MSLDFDARQRRMLQLLGVQWLGALEPTALPRQHQQPVPANRSEYDRNSRLASDSKDFVAIKIVANDRLNDGVNRGLVDPAIEGLDWAQLQQAVSQCQACGLSAGRRNTVFGVGPSPAEVMWVGEAPGDDEDQSGQAFAQQNGLLLAAMLGSLGYSNTGDGGVFVTHVTKCRVPSHRPLHASELAQCAPFLQRQVALVKPKLIVAAGPNAALQLLGLTEPLGKLRGRVHHLGDIAVIVTYPLGALMRNPADKAKSWQDLCLAADTLENLK